MVVVEEVGFLTCWYIMWLMCWCAHVRLKEGRAGGGRVPT